MRPRVGGQVTPIDPAGSSAFKLGRVVPSKFQLTSASSGISDLKAYITVMKVSNGVVGTEEPATSASSADSGNLFRYDPAAGQYVFNLATAGLSAGTWFLKVDMKDGVDRSAQFSIKP